MVPKTQKNINKLFQENFENFEMQPNELVWENIKTKLEEKKRKRRILPFWWRLSGVAAALVIGLLVYHKESETLPNSILFLSSILPLTTGIKKNGWFCIP